MNFSKLLYVPLAIALVAGCTSNQPRSDDSSKAPQAEDSKKSKIPSGMNEKGEVIDSSKVEGNTGTKVKGLSDTEGEIFGKPAAGSKLSKLQIGMSMSAVMSTAGQPSDQGAYITGKAFIPFYFGGDKHRFEWVYKGQGRLVFAGGGMGDMTGRLIRIVHNRNEPATR